MKPNEGIPRRMLFIHRTVESFWKIRLNIEFLYLKVKKKQMAPPWETFPQYPKGSMGWRMGGGEGYLEKWDQWFKKLSPSKRKLYQSRCPEPADWHGFYESREQRIK